MALPQPSPPARAARELCVPVAQPQELSSECPASPLRSRVFLASAQTGSQSAGSRDATPCPRHGSEAVDVDRGQFVSQSLKDCPVIADLHELAPVSGRATTRRHRRRFERFADVPYCQRRDGPPQLVIRRKHPAIAVPVLPRRRAEIGEPVEELGAA
jgi:hypothetical protein